MIKTWTLSDPTDVIGSIVGGNRYEWFYPNTVGAGGSIGTLAFDNSYRTGIVPDGPALTCFGSDVAKFQSPLDTDVTVKKANRTLPLRMALLDEDDIPQTDADLVAAPVLEVTYIGAATANPDLGEIDTTGKGDDGNMFVFAGSNWSLNMKTKGLAPGTYMLTTVSGDRTEYVIEPACNVTSIVQ